MIESDGVYDKDLQCNWIKWHAGQNKSLHLYLPAYNCTDMSGCVRVAKRLMPNVEHMTVIESDRHINSYDLRDGSWVCSFSGRRNPGATL
jgi:hypothetical protein